MIVKKKTLTLNFSKLNVNYILGVQIFCVLSVLCLFVSTAGATPAKVALIHSNPALGDLEDNIVDLTSLVEEAFLNNANIVVAPELATTGYAITREDVISYLGLTMPYPELDPIRDLAITYEGYVFMGFAEVTEEGGVYNGAVFYGPDGYIRTQHKRSLPLWHDAGTTPIEVVPTPYGDIAVMVCADSWLSDLARIATLDGADIIVTPANWWGRWDQEETWQVRAQENGVWFFTANRWGVEVDVRYDPPYTYNMNDAPSVVVNPRGKILQIHRAEDDPVPQTEILYQDINIPEYRIGNALTPTYTVNNREPSAYSEIGNLYYRRDLGYEEYPGLPPAGSIRASSMVYEPALSPAVNIATIESIWGEYGDNTDILVLPGLGVTFFPIESENPSWFTAQPWNLLQTFVESNSISLLITTVLEDGCSDFHESLILVRPGESPELIAQIHDSMFGSGSGEEPLIIDFDDGRIGVMSGRDSLFPEATAHLAKSGVDLLVISSAVGVNIPGAPFSSVNYFSDIETIRRMWRVNSNPVIHVLASDWTGNGIIVENGGGYISQVVNSDSMTPLVSMDLNSSYVRYKYLPAYQDHDIDALLSE